MDLSRRDVSAATLAALGTGMRAEAATADGISHDNAAIHQEVVLAAPASRIYQTPSRRAQTLRLAVTRCWAKICCRQNS